MSKIIACIKAPADRQDRENQIREILAFARNTGIHVDDFLEISVPVHAINLQRCIAVLLHRLKPFDTLIVADLSALGRSLPELYVMLNRLRGHNVRVIALREKLDLNRHCGNRCG